MQIKKDILEIKDLVIGYKSKKIKQILINNINETINGGELIALIGRNGTGKSSLLKTIVGLNNKISGDILYNRKSINEFSNTDKAKLISYVSTEKINLPNLKVFDIIALGRGVYTNWYGKISNNDYFIIDKALNIVNISYLKEKYFNQISDGEKQRVMIARAIAQDTKFIVLDEPTSFLDIPNKFYILSILENLSKEENKTVLFSSHDIDNIIDISDKIWLIDSKNLIIATPNEFKNKYLNDNYLSGTNLFFSKNENRIIKK